VSSMGESAWAEQTIEKITRICAGMEKKQQNKCRVKLLLRMVKRVGEYAEDNCQECEVFKEDVSQIIGMLIDVRNDEEVDYSLYDATIKQIKQHIQKDHKLLDEGTYMLQWLFIGVVAGVLLVNYYEGSVSLGISFGIIIGTILDRNAKKAGKVI
jgi:hypothetical protein